MLAKGKALKVLIATKVGAAGRHSRGETVERLRYKARKGNFWRCRMAVFVLDKNKKPLMHCSEKRARLLLDRRRAVVHKRFPFVIRLKDRFKQDSCYQPIRIKLDPGSKTTGIAITRGKIEADRVETVVFLAELNHRGTAIKSALDVRRGMRRNRRSRKIRYRAPRFNNRTRPVGWLAPSLQHRVDTTLSWVSRFSKFTPINAISQELIKFDMQIIQNPEISGVEYQQGELQGYEVKEYLLEKFNRCCTYCKAKNIPLEVEHVIAKSQGGSNRISNLCLSCRSCNKAKGALSIEKFLVKQPELLAHIKHQLKTSLKDAAAANTTRWALADALKTFGFPLELASGGQTKFNRKQFVVPKTHALDAACVGTIDSLNQWNLPTLNITCAGRGSYQRTRLNKYGSPRGYLTRQKQVKGFQTGDQVIATVPSGLKFGIHIGRVAVRATGNFNVLTSTGVVQGISYKHCSIISRADGYGYQTLQTTTTGGRHFLPTLKGRVSVPSIR